jgi:endonuclease/exonuclease/phosphatase (EEP) superfamily protein YafD
MVVTAIATLSLCACVTLTVEPRAVVSGRDHDFGVTILGCDNAARLLRERVGEPGMALDGRALRVVVWNIHKEQDDGWQRDLSSFAAGNDVLLLQETRLQPSLREALDDAGLRWVMASSFLYDAQDVGVLTATRVEALASCTQRALEPLLRIPKSAVISWLRIEGMRETLAIVNVHAINFDLFIDSYQSQFGALTQALADHQGPIIFAGDFNTWSDARDRVVAETAARLGMTELSFQEDRRATFFGRHFDHFFVRGLDLIEMYAIRVASSDHNPIVAILRVRWARDRDHSEASSKPPHRSIAGKQLPGFLQQKARYADGPPVAYEHTVPTGSHRSDGGSTVEARLNLKTAILASAVALAIGVSAARAEGDATQSNDTSATKAQPSGSMTGKQKATAIGAGTGAVAGAVVGGPIGAVVGAGVGGYVGHEGTDANGHVSTSSTGSAGDSTVRKAQAALNDQGFGLAVDGRFGPNTQSAVRSFQEKNGLAATGTLDSPTLGALGVN